MRPLFFSFYIKIFIYEDLTRYDTIELTKDISKKGEIVMSEYRRLDLSKLHFVQTPISYEEAVKNATPFEITEEALNNKRGIQVTKAEKDYERKCVKLEILY